MHFLDDSRIPLTWPKGTYGLPMPKSGCPKGTAFQWQNGTRYQDTEDDSANNQWSPSWDLAGRADKNNMEQRFCIKTNSDGFLPWPKGQYCIFKKGPCPKGLWKVELSWEKSYNSFQHLCPEMNAIARITNQKSKEQNNENSISSRKLQKLQITNSRLSQK